jgi:type I restriction enzyme S subunit
MFVADNANAYKVYEQKNAIKKDCNLGSYFIDQQKFNELKGFEVYPNDIIVSCAGTIGETYVLPENIRAGIINQALMIIRLFSHELQEFYLLYFDFILKNQATNESKGTAIKNIPPFDVLKSFLIPIPPIAEQQRILVAVSNWMKAVSMIESDVDDINSLIINAKSKILDLAISGMIVPQIPSDEPAIEALRRVNPNFKPCDNPQYQHKIISLPNTWCCATFDSINTYKSASVNPASNPNEIYELYSVPTFETGMPEFIIGDQIASTKALVKSRDVLLCKINPHLNRAWVVSHHRKDLRCIASSEWIVFRNEALNSSYMQLCLTSPYFKELMMSNVSGVGGSLMRAQPIYVKKYTIPIPPIAEQQRIVDKVNELFTILDSIQNSLDAN